jgi:hypothetical protein
MRGDTKPRRITLSYRGPYLSTGTTPQKNYRTLQTSCAYNEGYH